MGLSVLIGTSDSQLSLLSAVREIAPLAEGNWLHKFLENEGFCLSSRIWGKGVFFEPGIMSQLYQIQQKLFSWHPSKPKMFVRDPEESFTHFPRYVPHVLMFYYEKKEAFASGGRRLLTSCQDTLL